MRARVRPRWTKEQLLNQARQKKRLNRENVPCAHTPGRVSRSIPAADVGRCAEGRLNGFETRPRSHHVSFVKVTMRVVRVVVGWSVVEIRPDPLQEMN